MIPCPSLQNHALKTKTISQWERPRDKKFKTTSHQRILVCHHLVPSHTKPAIPLSETPQHQNTEMKGKFKVWILWTHYFNYDDDNALLSRRSSAEPSLSGPWNPEKEMGFFLNFSRGPGSNLPPPSSTFELFALSEQFPTNHLGIRIYLCTQNFIIMHACTLF